MESVPLKPEPNTWEVILTIIYLLGETILVINWGLAVFEEWLDWQNGCLKISLTDYVCNYYYNTSICCLRDNNNNNNEEVILGGCCNSNYSDVYIHENIPKYASSIRYIRFSFISSFFVWGFQVGILWWQSFVCGCCCVNDTGESKSRCCNREKNVCGKQRVCVWKIFYCNDYSFTGLGLLQWCSFLFHFIPFIFGIYAYHNFFKNDIIVKMDNYGGTRNGLGARCAVSAIIMEAAYLLTLIMQSWIGYTSGRCCVSVSQKPVMINYLQPQLQQPQPLQLEDLQSETTKKIHSEIVNTLLAKKLDLT